MDIQTLCDRAWGIAEAKGLHANLDQVTTLGAREQALLECARVFCQLVKVIQVIKKQGVSLEVWDTKLFDLEHALHEDVTALFDRLLHLCGGHIPDTPVALADTVPASTIRLLLMGTEIGEALEVVNDPMQLPREVGDVFVRGGDFIKGLPLPLPFTAILEDILDANAQRPYAYGTPDEGKGD